MKIYRYDHSGFFCGEGEADESPLEPGIFLVPALATSLPAPAVGAGERAVFDGGAWRVETVPVQTAPPPTKAERIAALTTAYKTTVAQMQLNWLAASVTGGTSEATKKEAIQQDLLDLKTQYTTDLNTIRNS